MKPSLQLRISQSLTMTPQLQQAIKLLQLSSLELQTEIQQALETNPMLEMSDDNDELPDDDAQTHGVDTDADLEFSTRERYEQDEFGSAPAGDDLPEFGEAPAAPAVDDMDSAEALSGEGVRDELPVDAQWEDWDFSAPSGSGSGGEDDEFEVQGKTSESLQDSLHWQLNLTPFSDTDRAIAVAIIDAIDDDGYLRANLEDVLEAVGNADVESDEVLAVLHRLQQFEPPGVAARDLAECLLIQLRQSGPASGTKDPVHRAALALVKDYLPLLASRDFRGLMRKLRIDEDLLREVIACIQSLNPRPGSALAKDESNYVTPDILVSKHRGRWRVELNSDVSPRLRVNNSYASLIQRSRNATDNSYLRNHLQEAKWFIKSLQSRNETLLRVGTAIVEQQIGFFEHGPEAMRPMVLADIAGLLELHESTISRVTSNKYMHTPRGIFELKYFFSSHLGTSDGGEASSTAIRALIKKLVAQEDASKPLSDSQIAQTLGEQGINVARRTVAKYREALGIAPSNERKSLG